MIKGFLIPSEGERIICLVTYEVRNKDVILTNVRKYQEQAERLLERMKVSALRDVFSRFIKHRSYMLESDLTYRTESRMNALSFLKIHFAAIEKSDLKTHSQFIINSKNYIYELMPGKSSKHYEFFVNKGRMLFAFCEGQINENKK